MLYMRDESKAGLALSEARQPLSQQASFLTISDMFSSHSLLGSVSEFQEFITLQCLEGSTLLYDSPKQVQLQVYKVAQFSEILRYVAFAGYLPLFLVCSYIIFLCISSVFRDIFQRPYNPSVSHTYISKSKVDSTAAHTHVHILCSNSGLLITCVFALLEAG